MGVKSYDEIEYDNLVKRHRFEGAGLEKELMERYYDIKFHIVLTLYNHNGDDRSDSQVIDTFRRLAQKKALVGRPRKIEALILNDLKSTASTRTRRNGQVVNETMLAKEFSIGFKDEIHGLETEKMLDTHISWFGYSDYQPQRNSINKGGRVLHYHLFPDFDRDVSMKELQEKLNSLWYFGDVWIREYQADDVSVSYGRFKHENYIEGISCRRVKQGIDRLCCKAGRTCRYLDNNGDHSAMWFNRHNN